MTARTRAEPLSVVRLILLVALVAGLVGTTVELFLLEHTEDTWQWVPVALLGLALVVLAWHAAYRGPASVRTFQALMGVFVLSGLLGIWLHYRGNVEFELEMYPDLSGWKLFRDSMMGATPALAPGTMIQLGLVGLAWAFRHPALRTGPSTESEQERTP